MLVADPSKQNRERDVRKKKEEEKWISGLIDIAAVAQEKRLSDTPCSTLEGHGEGPQRAANGQDSWDFFKDAQGLGGWMLARALTSPAQGLHHHELRYFQFSLYLSASGC